MRRRIGGGWLAAALALTAPAAEAQEATASASGGLSASTTGTAAMRATGGTDGLFLEPTLGFGMPVGDGHYDLLVDISFVPAISVGWLFGIGDAAIGPEAWITYTPLNVDDDYLGAGWDVYGGRFRVAGGARFHVDLGALYLFTHLGVGFELVHANWEYDVGPLHYDDDESDGGLVILPGFGFGGRLADWVGLTMRLDFPTAMHWDDDDGGVDFDYHSTDIEVDFGVTFFL
ncbi:MAG: hypothetical protein JXB32_16770 [Deltaproteobacteria bacterium]|nr:hypothetical protein [Deltaproteobacteria bacterium]